MGQVQVHSHRPQLQAKVQDVLLLMAQMEQLAVEIVENAVLATPSGDPCR